MHGHGDPRFVGTLFLPPAPECAGRHVHVAGGPCYLTPSGKTCGSPHSQTPRPPPSSPRSCVGGSSWRQYTRPPPSVGASDTEEVLRRRSPRALSAPTLLGSLVGMLPTIGLHVMRAVARHAPVSLLRSLLPTAHAESSAAGPVGRGIHGGSRVSDAVVDAVAAPGAEASAGAFSWLMNLFATNQFASVGLPLQLCDSGAMSGPSFPCMPRCQSHPGPCRRCDRVLAVGTDGTASTGRPLKSFVHDGCDCPCCVDRAAWPSLLQGSWLRP